MVIHYLYGAIFRHFKPSFSKKFKIAIESLSYHQQKVIIYRYLDMVEEAEHEYRKIKIFYIIFTNVVTVAGVLITGLISLDKINLISSTFAEILFWIVWALSILLTLANKLIYSFNIHKKYVISYATLEKFYSEGWMFIAGIGRYNTINLDKKFKLFCTRIELIKFKSIESLPEVETNDEAGDILAMVNNDERTKDKSDKTTHDDDNHEINVELPTVIEEFKDKSNIEKLVEESQHLKK